VGTVPIEALEFAMLAHNVYFTLEDRSLEKVEGLIAACKKYLAKHPGVVFFAAGSRNPDLDRPVNDGEFDVALHVIFTGRESHDAYQAAEEHKVFIEEQQANWKRVRVFDSDVDGAE